MYTIKVLKDRDFFDVVSKDPRYKNVDQDNLGFADTQKKRAYVRYTSYPFLNKYLIDHEFEHLVESHATDEDEFGIRHKKGKKFFKDLFMPIMTGGLSKMFNTSPVNKESTTGSITDMFGLGGGQQDQQTSQSPMNQFYPNEQSSSAGMAPTTGSSGISGGLTSGDVNTMGQGQSSLSPQVKATVENLMRQSGFWSGMSPRIQF